MLEQVIFVPQTSHSKSVHFSLSQLARALDSQFGIQTALHNWKYTLFVRSFVCRQATVHPAYCSETIFIVDSVW